MKPMEKGSKMSKPQYLGHRKRLKTKYLENSINGWLGHEILEFALFYAVPRKDTKPLAKQLLSKYSNISGVLEADLKELSQMPGMTENSAIFLKFLKDISVLYHKEGVKHSDLINSPESLVNYLKARLKGQFQEEFLAVFLNKGNHLIAVETMQTGTVDSSVVYPRKIAERALYHKAVNVIVAHNHPGLSLEPSKDDILTTKSIASALETLGVRLLDHIIISKEGHFSFKERCLL